MKIMILNWVENTLYQQFLRYSNQVNQLFSQYTLRPIKEGEGGEGGEGEKGRRGEGEKGRRGEGERRGDGEMGRWGDGEMVRW